MMEGPKADPPSSPGTEEPISGHYMVAAPGTHPLGRESDLQLADLFTKLAKGDTHYVDFTARLSDPSQLHRNPDLPQWVRVRVYVDFLTVVIDGEEISFNGTGFMLVGRSIFGDPRYDREEREAEPSLICAVTVTAHQDQAPPAPGTFVGDLSITDSGGIP